MSVAKHCKCAFGKIQHAHKCVQQKRAKGECFHPLNGSRIVCGSPTSIVQRKCPDEPVNLLSEGLPEAERPAGSMTVQKRKPLIVPPQPKPRKTVKRMPRPFTQCGITSGCAKLEEARPEKTNGTSTDLQYRYLAQSPSPMPKALNPGLKAVKVIAILMISNTGNFSLCQLFMQLQQRKAHTSKIASWTEQTASKRRQGACWWGRSSGRS